MRLTRVLSPTALFVSLFGASLAGFGCATDVDADGAISQESPLGVGGLCAGERCDSVARGRNAFTASTAHALEGNGRACADCHMPSDSFQLSPANVEARFQAKGTKDPLFQPLDADDFRVNGANASDFTTLRQDGLVRVSFELGANADVLDPATGQWSKTVDVWRATPSLLDVKLTGSDGTNPWARDPNKTGGYQLDGREATLQSQARGAFFGHSEIQVEPSQRMLDDIAAFENTLFTSDRTRDLAAAIANNVSPLPDADPELTSLEQQGKAVFTRACGHCHGGAGQTTTIAPVFRYHDINTACPRPADNPNMPGWNGTPRWKFAACSPNVNNKIRTYRFKSGPGYVTRASSDPGRALLAGAFVGGPAARDDWNKLDVPTVRNIRNTAPYFHNNSAATLEDVLDHYDAFFTRVSIVAPRPGGVVPPVLSTDGVHVDRPVQNQAERDALLAYLLKI